MSIRGCATCRVIGLMIGAVIVSVIVFLSPLILLIVWSEAGMKAVRRWAIREDIDTSDIPETSPEWFKRAGLRKGGINEPPKDFARPAPPSAFRPRYPLDKRGRAYEDEDGF